MLRLICGIVFIQTTLSVSLATVHGQGESKGVCADKYEMCSYWAKQKACEKHTSFMMSNCRSSCYFCGDPECDVGIAGGGAAGLYMAYKLLLKKNETNVCVFEKESSTGGRILDHAFKEAPDISVALGSWRIAKEHRYMIALQKELGIAHPELIFPKPSLQESRGTKTNNHETLRKGYPNLMSHPVVGNMTSDDLYNYAMKPEHVANAGNFATTHSYFSHYITPEGTAFLSELWEFKGDYEDFISPQAYIEWRKYSDQNSGNYIRPPRGMSEITKALAERIVSLGGKIYTNSPVKQLVKKRGHYFLITPTMKARAKKLVIALTPLQIEELAGDVAERIKRTSQLKSIMPLPAFRAIAVYATPWWENVTIDGTPVIQGRNFVSFSNCMGNSIVYWGKSNNGESVLNTMYNDGECARKWRDLSKLGKDVIDREAHRALEMKYGMKIPKPIDTVYKFWDDAWHFQKPGFNFTLLDIEKWAKRPFPKEDIFLVNEAFHFLRAECEGAVRTSENALEEGWGRIVSR